MTDYNEAASVAVGVADGPDGYVGVTVAVWGRSVILTPDLARHIARLLTLTAEQADRSHHG